MLLMSSNLLLAVFAGLAGMLGWGFADFFAKKTIDKVGDLTTLAWAHIYGAGIILGAVIVSSSISQRNFPIDGVELGKLAFFGALQACVYFFAYKAFAKGQLSLLNPVFSSYSAFVVILSVLFFGEVLGLSLFLVLVLVICGIIFTNLDSSTFVTRRIKFLKVPGMSDILIAVGLASGWTVLWGNFVSGKDWLVYAAMMYLLMAGAILIKCVVDGQNLKIGKKGIHGYFFLIGLSEIVAYAGVSLGYSKTTHLSVIAVLSAAFSVPTLVLAHVFLKERITPLQYTGVLTVIVGVVIIYLL